MKRTKWFLSFFICLLFFPLSGCRNNEPAGIQTDIQTDMQEAAAAGEKHM